MTTSAKTIGQDSSHWYYLDGKPCYELPKKYGDGMKVPTLADARKLNLLPSVTTILKCLHKQALVDWLIEQACLAVLTSPRNPGEELDAFVYRVLHTERVQDQESQAARDLGGVIHDALEHLFRREVISEYIQPWVLPCFDAIATRGKVVAVERCVVGNGYAGKLDLQLETPTEVWLWDWKTTKRLPDKGAWPEHRMQLAAYAAAIATPDKPVRTGNVYISTVEQGAFKVCEHDDWMPAYEHGFKPLVEHWQWSTGYFPAQLPA